MAEQQKTSEKITQSDGKSTNATKSGAKQPPSKTDALGIFLSALSVMKTAGIEFEVASQDGKAYLVIDASRWLETEAGLQIETIEPEPASIQ